MKNGVKKIICIVLFIFCIPGNSFAKIISDDSGSITFETSNQWRLTSYGEDPLTYELISITLDKNTGIKVSQSKYYSKYKNLMQASEAEKSALRDSMIRYYLNYFKSKGYNCTVDKAEYFDDSIMLRLIVKNNNLTGIILTSAYIKDYCMYSISAFCVDETIKETAKVLDTLKVDGVDFEKWIVN